MAFGEEIQCDSEDGGDDHRRKHRAHPHPRSTPLIKRVRARKQEAPDFPDETVQRVHPQNPVHFQRYRDRAFLLRCASMMMKMANPTAINAKMVISAFITLKFSTVGGSLMLK